jgi:hypothetical protein
MAVINPGVTSVTATSPVTSSGGTAPNIALTTSGANSVVIRDANQNVFANSFNDNYINVAASATQITLTVASTRRYTITGSGGQVIRLPDATTLVVGAIFEFDNNQSSGAITVNNNSNTLVVSVPSGGVVRVNLLSNAIAAGSWDRHDLTPANVSWSTNTLDYAGSITSATWNGNTVQVNRGGTGVTTSTGSGSNVLNTSPTLTTPAITGGTIDNTVIGGTTPAAGTFTTLTSPILKSATGSTTTGVSLDTPLGAQATIIDIGDGTRPLRLNGGSAGAVNAAGVGSSVGILQLSGSNSDVRTYTGGRGSTLQFNVLHTASAVNYVQVTGAATGSAPTISAQGSDATLNLNLASKGSGSNILFQINALNAFQVSGTGTVVNRLLARAAIAGAAPALETVGTDTDIDLTLTPKGAGAVRFGTLTATADTAISGYITIKDSGGTLRKLAVIT